LFKFLRNKEIANLNTVKLGCNEHAWDQPSLFVITVIFYNIKEFVPPKMSLNNREFLIWKERGRGVGGREREGRVGRSAGTHS
jgi:hypothetical protein